MLVPDLSSGVSVMDKVLSEDNTVDIYLRRGSAGYIVSYAVPKDKWERLSPTRVLSDLGRLDYGEYFLVVAHEDGLSLYRLWIPNALPVIESSSVELAHNLASQITDGFVGEEYNEHAQLIPANEVNSVPIKVSEAGQIT